MTGRSIINNISVNEDLPKKRHLKHYISYSYLPAIPWLLEWNDEHCHYGQYKYEYINDGVGYTYLNQRA